MFEQQDAGWVVLGWTVRAREVSRSALDALSVSAAAKARPWLVAVQGALIEPLAGESVFVGVELSPEDAELVEGTTLLASGAQTRAASKRT